MHESRIFKDNTKSNMRNESDLNERKTHIVQKSTVFLYRYY